MNREGNVIHWADRRVCPMNDERLTRNDERLTMNETVGAGSARPMGCFVVAVVK